MRRVDYPVRAFSESKVLQDTTMRQYFEFSKSLLKGAREGKIIEVRGRDLVTGLPHTIEISADEQSASARSYYTVIQATGVPGLSDQTGAGQDRIGVNGPQHRGAG